MMVMMKVRNFILKDAERCAIIIYLQFGFVVRLVSFGEYNPGAGLALNLTAYVSALFDVPILFIHA